MPVGRYLATAVALAALSGCSLLAEAGIEIETPDFLLTQQVRTRAGSQPQLAGLPMPGWAAIGPHPADSAEPGSGAVQRYTVSDASCVVETRTVVATSTWGRGDDRYLSDQLVKRFVAAHTQGTPMAGIEKSLKISEVTLRGDRGAVSVREGAAKITGYEQRVVARVAETSGQAILISYTCQGPVDYAKWTALKDATTVVGFLPESFAD